MVVSYLYNGTSAGLRPAAGPREDRQEALPDLPDFDPAETSTRSKTKEP